MTFGIGRGVLRKMYGRQNLEAAPLTEDLVLEPVATAIFCASRRSQSSLVLQIQSMTTQVWLHPITQTLSITSYSKQTP
jgi:hypothetical protein